MAIWSLMQAVVVALQALLAVPVLYLVAITAAALGSRLRDVLRRRVRGGTAQGIRFAVLIPAHNEEVLLGQLLESLAAQDYPREQYQVIVIADNCTDATSARAGGFAGVWVYERHDLTNRGKGQALRWAFERLEAEGHIFDAYIIVDADSRVERDVLAQFAGAIARGAQAVQSRYTVLNAEEAPSAALRWLALTLMNHVRPWGRVVLGGSSQLLGNGMCFTRALLERHPWRADALSEDYQYYLTLVQDGERIHYLPYAVVSAHMPTTFAQLRTQDIRWESPQPEHAERYIARKLLFDGLRNRDVVRLEALMRQLTPPLSSLVALVVVSIGAGALLGSAVSLLLGTALFAGVLIYIGSAFVLARPPRMLAKAILFVPGFVVWKLWVVLVLSRSKKHTSEWIRTPRPTAAASASPVSVPTLPADRS